MKILFAFFRNGGSHLLTLPRKDFLQQLSSSIFLTLPATSISQSYIKKNINSNFYFHTSLWRLKRFYQGLKGVFKMLWSITKSENKNLSYNKYLFCTLGTIITVWQTAILYTAKQSLFNPFHADYLSLYSLTTSENHVGNYSTFLRKIRQWSISFNSSQKTSGKNWA